MYSECGRTEKELSVRWETSQVAFEKAKEWLKQWGFEDRVLEFDVSSATVELAAVSAPLVSDQMYRCIWMNP